MTIKERRKQLYKEIQDQFDMSPKEWLTLKLYLDCMFGMGFDEGRKHLSHKVKVIQLKDGIKVEEFDSIADAARAVGVDIGSIGHILAGRKGSHTCKGFGWKYA